VLVKDLNTAKEVLELIGLDIKKNSIKKTIKKFDF